MGVEDGIGVGVEDGIGVGVGVGVGDGDGDGLGRSLPPLIWMYVDVPPAVLNDSPKVTEPVAADISLLVILALVVQVSL